MKSRNKFGLVPHHLRLQSRGGPLQFELSSWLQIEGAEPQDSGTYHCIARNSLGSSSASAALGVLPAGEVSLISSRIIQFSLLNAPLITHTSDWSHDFALFRMECLIQNTFWLVT